MANISSFIAHLEQGGKITRTAWIDDNVTSHLSVQDGWMVRTSISAKAKGSMFYDLDFDDVSANDWTAVA